MPILDPSHIPTEIQDQIEAAGESLGSALVRLHDGTEPDPSEVRVRGLAEAFQRTLTAFAMMMLDEPPVMVERPTQWTEEQLGS